MVESMTGFGRSERSDEHGTVLVEVRSVNGRYLKVMLRVPEVLQSREPEIENLVRSRVSRGTLTVVIHLKAIGLSAAWQVNEEVVQAYVEALEVLRERLSNRSQLRLDAVAALPGAVEPVAQTDPGETIWPLTVGAVEEALEALVQMRRVEGRALAEVLLAHARQVEALTAAVAERAPGVVSDWRDRLRARVEELLAGAGVSVSGADLAREVAFFAERADITEELNRLRSHLDQFRGALAGEASVGRTLEFLIQEMLREANTIAAKANDAEIAHQVVLVKSELDRMKEQVQNVA